MVDRAARAEEIDFEAFLAVDLRVAAVLAAPVAEGTRARTRKLTLDVGELGTLQSVGQFALVDEEDLVGARVVACVNLGRRQIGRHPSEALVLGTPHPQSPVDETQALPLRADPMARPGDRIF
jgi:tRNA-binding protein